MKTLTRTIRGFFVNDIIDQKDLKYAWMCSAFMLLILFAFSIYTQYAGLTKVTNSALIAWMFSVLFELGANMGMMGVVGMASKMNSLKLKHIRILVPIVIFMTSLYCSFNYSYIGRQVQTINEGGGLKSKTSLNDFNSITDKYDNQLKRIDDNIEKQQDVLNGINGDLTLCEAEQGKYENMKWQRYSKTRNTLRNHSKKASARLNKLQNERVNQIHRIEKNRQIALNRINSHDLVVDEDNKNTVSDAERGSFELNIFYAMMLALCHLFRSSVVIEYSNNTGKNKYRNRQKKNVRPQKSKAVKNAMDKGITDNKKLYEEVKKKVPESRYEDKNKFEADVRAMKSKYKREYTDKEKTLIDQLDKGQTSIEGIEANYSDDSQVNVNKLKYM